MIVFKGWSWGLGEVGNGAIKEHGYVAGVDGVGELQDDWEIARDGCNWIEVEYGEAKGCKRTGVGC